jgi:hypothetical protein
MHLHILVLALVLCACACCVSGKASASGKKIKIEETSADPDGCLARGFNMAVLRCNACDAIAKTLENAQAEKDCRKCCQPTLQVARETFELVVLEIDQRFVSKYPEIQKAVLKHKEEGSSSKRPYSALAVRFSFGARPTLHLYKERDDELPAESVMVGSWNLDVLEDYVLESTQDA